MNERLQDYFVFDFSQHNANLEVENRIAHIKTAFKNEEARQLEET